MKNKMMVGCFVQADPTMRSVGISPMILYPMILCFLPPSFYFNSRIRRLRNSNAAPSACSPT